MRLYVAIFTEFIVVSLLQTSSFGAGFMFPVRGAPVGLCCHFLTLVRHQEKVLAQIIQLLQLISASRVQPCLQCTMLCPAGRMEQQCCNAIVEQSQEVQSRFAIKGAVNQEVAGLYSSKQLGILLLWHGQHRCSQKFPMPFCHCCLIGIMKSQRT